MSWSSVSVCSEVSMSPQMRSIRLAKIDSANHLFQQQLDTI